MSGGYDSSAAGKLLASVSMREEIEEHGGQPEAMCGLVDHRKGWAKLEGYRRDMLYQYIHNEAEPPVLDIDKLQLQIAERQARGKQSHNLVRRVQEQIALRRFAGEMNGKYDDTFGEPRWALVNAGAAHRGACEGCHRWVQDGPVWRDLRSRRIYHLGCRSLDKLQPVG